MHRTGEHPSINRACPTKRAGLHGYKTPASTGSKPHTAAAAVASHQESELLSCREAGKRPWSQSSSCPPIPSSLRSGSSGGNGWRVPPHGAPGDHPLRRRRQHHLLPCVPGTSHDVPAGVPQEVHGRVQLGAVRGGTLQLGSLDLLRFGQDQLPSTPDHKRLRVWRRSCLHHLLPRVRAAQGEAEDPCLLLPHGRGGVRAHRGGHPLRCPQARPGQVPRQRLPRLLHGRLRGPTQHHRQGRQDQERRVLAHQPLLLPHTQCRRLVLLWPLHQGPLRHVPERGRLLLQLRADGTLVLVPQATEHERRAADDRRRIAGAGGRAGAGAGDRAGGQHHCHPVGEPDPDRGRAQDRGRGAAAQGRRRRRRGMQDGRRQP